MWQRARKVFLCFYAEAVFGGVALNAQRTGFRFLQVVFEQDCVVYGV